MQALAILLIGFSLFSALSIALGHFHGKDYRASVRAAGLLLLLILGGLQFMHYLYLQQGNDNVHGVIYRILLFSAAPAFYLFSRPVLLGSGDNNWRDLLHFLPALGAVFLPFDLALPLSFLLGAGYLAWLARRVLALRQQRRQFQWELAMLGGIFLIALLVMLMGLGLSAVDEQLFFTLYAMAIGLAFLLITVALLLKPRLSSDISEAARETYVTSTLARVDCPAALKKLQTLMAEAHVYLQSDLSLSRLAAQLELAPHQLSELINTRLGKSFSRYLREQRVAEAARLLLEKPSMSVLEIGLSAGFSSQSNYYDAFREITGMTPGKYRSLHRRSPAK
jgi:AraC-like DNA-binding protein